AKSLNVFDNELDAIGAGAAPGQEFAGIYLRQVWEGAIVGNMITSVGNSSFASAYGVRVEGGSLPLGYGRVRISSNTIVGVVGNPTVGIFGTGPLENIEIADNRIDGSGAFSQGGGRPEGYAIRILETAQSPSITRVGIIGNSLFAAYNIFL